MGGAARLRGAAHMPRRLAFLLALVLGGAILAQGARSVGTSIAEVPLEVTFDFAPVLQLRLALDTVAFDLNRVGEPDGAVCVLGSGPDELTGSGPDGGDAVAPSGTSLTIGAWPTLEARGGIPLTSYPPPPDQAAGGVVCYRAFALDAYVNVGAWQLGVERSGAFIGAPFPETYVVSACPGDALLDLLPIADGERRTLRLGSTPEGCTEMLVAVAVRIDGALAGTARTDLRYTLLAADADFATE